MPDSSLPPLPLLLETQELEARLHDPSVRIIDASWHMKAANRDADAEHRSAHIPGAVRFDVDVVADTASHLPHMAPLPEVFARHVSQLGIGNDTNVVVYDAEGMSSAACRVWWMFRLFGHNRVSVLDGGLPKWKTEARPLEKGTVTPTPVSFTPSLRPELIRNAEQIIANIATGAEQVIDARAAARFQGQAQEPWPVDKIGHMPGAINLPFTDLIDPETRCFLPKERLHALFDDAGLDPNRPIVISCGSGITACVVAFALALAGWPDAAVYDGSWVDWGTRLDTPVEAG